MSLINGVPLDNPGLGWSVQSDSELRGSWSRDRVSVRRAGRDGFVSGLPSTVSGVARRFVIDAPPATSDALVALFGDVAVWESGGREVAVEVQGVKVSALPTATPMDRVAVDVMTAGPFLRSKSEVTVSAALSSASVPVEVFARAVKAGAVPERRNRHVNPSASGGVGWSFTASGALGTQSTNTITPWFPGGPTTAQRRALTAAATYLDVRFSSNAMNLVGSGDVTSVSMWAQWSRGGSLVGYVQWLDSVGTLISTVNLPPLGNVVADVPVKIEAVNLPRPSGATVAVLIARVSASFVAGDLVDGTAGLVEGAPVLGPFFDGSTAATATSLFLWDGLVNASTSSMYARSDILSGISAPVQDAVIRVKGAATGIQITDQSGAWVTLPDVAAGRWVRFEADTGRAFETTTDTWTGGTEVSGAVDFGGPRGVFEITPALTPGDPTSRVGRLTVTTASRSGAVVEVRGKSAHLL